MVMLTCCSSLEPALRRDLPSECSQLGGACEEPGDFDKIHIVNLRDRGIVRFCIFNKFQEVSLPLVCMVPLK